MTTGTSGSRPGGPRQVPADVKSAPGAGQPIATYIDPATLPYAFCPGCSHTRVVEQLDAALGRLQIDPRDIVIVSDIGCAGIADKYFATHAFHGLHGRSVTYATGIKLAQPDMHVIVLIGDGGCGIGGHHLINAARRNIGVTVVVFNNFNYGMTGGQYSATTPEGAITATSPIGHLEHPLDIAGTVAVNGAELVARTTAYDPALDELLARAVSTDGFALVDVWEMCVAYFVPRNDFRRSALDQSMSELGLTSGIVHIEPRPEYTAAYRAAAGAAEGQATLAPRPLPALREPVAERPLRITIAGAAGQRVRTAATALAAGGVVSGLWATRRDDYPITVRTGYSLSEVILSPAPVRYTGAENPDVVLVLAPEGAARARSLLAALGGESLVLTAGGEYDLATRAAVRELELSPEARKHARKGLSMVAVARAVADLGLYPVGALREAVVQTHKPDVADANLAAIDAAVAATDDAR